MPTPKQLRVRWGGWGLLLAALPALAWVGAGHSLTFPPSRSMTAVSAAEKFVLAAGPCAAKGYPMTIEVGKFSGPDGSSFPVPSGHYLEGDWGVASRVWAVGDEQQPAPARLDLLYFSYAEDRFYEGSFALPTAQLQAQLHAGFWDLDDQRPATYTKLTVCVLPKGLVVVWLTGAGRQVLAGHYWAHEAAVSFQHYFPATDRAAMRREQLAELPASVQAQVAAGTISARPWEAYLQAYPWQLAFSQPLKLTHYEASFLSGEITNYPLTPDRAPYLQLLLGPAPKAAPRRLSLHVTDVAGHRYALRADAFDEAETLAAFRALHPRAAAGPLTLLVETDKYLKKATLVLQSATEHLALTKTPVRIIELD